MQCLRADDAVELLGRGVTGFSQVEYQARPRVSRAVMQDIAVGDAIAAESNRIFVVRDLKDAPANIIAVIGKKRFNIQLLYFQDF